MKAPTPPPMYFTHLGLVKEITLQSSTHYHPTIHLTSTAYYANTCCGLQCLTFEEGLLHCQHLPGCFHHFWNCVLPSSLDKD